MPIIVPIVAFLTLGAWLGMVYWADAHPEWKTHSTGDAMPDNLKTWIKIVLTAAEKGGLAAVAKRPIRFFGAILVAAVPAYFTFVPPDPGTTIWPDRAVIMIAWVLLLIFAIYIASAHDISIDRLAARTRYARTRFRNAAADDILKRLIPPPDDIAKGYTWALYVPAPGDPTLLIPIPVLSTESAAKWHVGRGVTGTAFKTGKLQIGRDDELKPGGRFALDPDQSLHLQDFRTVVAQPVMNGSGQAVGVLTAATTTDQRELLGGEGRRLLAYLSFDVARVLIDMLNFEE